MPVHNRNTGGPPGRPRLKGEVPPAKSIKLTEEHWLLARKIGSGNMTEGIRLALDFYARSKSLTET